MIEKCKKASALIRNSKSTVVLTGAGISTESGIPDFRSPDTGLWSNMDPMEALSTRVLFDNPEKFYEVGFKMLISMKDAKPNRAHEILAKLEEEGKVKLIITQNIDNLHYRAGSKNVYEVHGNTRTFTCMKCEKVYNISDIEKKVEEGDVPPRCICGGITRPDVVMFGDMLPDCFQDGVREVKLADLLIVIGSSLTVYPVSQLAAMGKKLIIINFTETPYDNRSDVVIRENISDTLEKIYEFLG